MHVAQSFKMETFDFETHSETEEHKQFWQRKAYSATRLLLAVHH